MTAGTRQSGSASARICRTRSQPESGRSSSAAKTTSGTSCRMELSASAGCSKVSIRPTPMAASMARSAESIGRLLSTTETTSKSRSRPRARWVNMEEDTRYAKRLTTARRRRYGQGRKRAVNAPTKTDQTLLGRASDAKDRLLGNLEIIHSFCGRIVSDPLYLALLSESKHGHRLDSLFTNPRKARGAGVTLSA